MKDSNSLTNLIEADEAYVIGKRGQYTPVGAYLAGDEIIKIALEHGANMIHPGSFLSAQIKITLLEKNKLTDVKVTASFRRTPSLPRRSRTRALW